MSTTTAKGTRESSGVQVERARPSDRSVLEAMYRTYLQELAAYTDDLRTDRPLPEEWFEGRSELHPLLVTLDGDPAGFVLVLEGARAAAVFADTDCYLHDLFVCEEARGQGVARRAVELTLAGHRGRWGLCVLRRNSRALAFWKRILAGHGPGFEAGPEAGTLAVRFRS